MGRPTQKSMYHWYLPTGSIVKVEWSSEHYATTAGQWDEDDLLYPIDGEIFHFPLHHDITDEYKPDTEVFIIEQLPVRILRRKQARLTLVHIAPSTARPVLGVTPM